MESRAGSSHGAQTPKKSRSLDLKSLYKSKVSKESVKEGSNKGRKRKSTSVYSGGEENSKKKSKKETLVSNPKNADRNSKKSLAELYNGDIGTGLKDPGSPERENGISVPLGGDAIHIPKRKRGFVGRKKLEASSEAEVPGHAASVQGSSDQATKSVNGDSGNGVNLASDTQVESNHDRKEDINNPVNSDQDGKEKLRKENINSPVILDQNDREKLDGTAKTDELLPKKPRKNRRKKKNVEMGARKFVEVDETLINDSVKACNDLPEEDEENLEENAAMMLSSRFDPSCTGFGSKSKASRPSKSKPSFSRRRRNSGGSRAGSDPESVDAANWKLRPRKQHIEGGLMRKRRHFYDIIADELDPLWILDKKIKVFWPLDEKWYYGLVNDYDEERKVHHIKYDDRDEEWVDLHNEKFKLLLLRSEIPNVVGGKKGVSVDKHLHMSKENLKPPKEDRKRGLRVTDDNSVLDSEPIISWLARSKASTSHDAKKPSTSHGVKKQKSSPSPHSSLSLLSDEKANLGGSLVDVSPRRKKRKLHKNSVDRPGRRTDSAMKNAVSLKERTLPIVYVRRHCRKPTETSLGKREYANVLASELECGVCVTSVTEGFEVYDGDGISAYQFSRSILDSNSEELNIVPLKLEDCIFELGIPISSFLRHSFRAQNFQLIVTLPQQGMVMSLWPKVHLEMLFVDSVDGLRFLLFEGSLKETIEFIFLVMTLFTPSHEEEKNQSLQAPTTSISFKFVSIQGCRRQLAFAFYSFYKLKQSKWMYLDRKMTRHCLLANRLPLSECTYANVRMIQNGISRLPTSSQSGPSLKGLQKKQRPCTCKLSVQKDGSRSSASDSCHLSHNCRTLPPFALSFSAAPTFLLGLHLELLMKNTVFKASALNLLEHESVDLLEKGSCCRCVDFCAVKMAPLNDALSNGCLSSDEADIGKTGIADDHSNTRARTSEATKRPDLDSEEQLNDNHANLERLPRPPTKAVIPEKTCPGILMNGISVVIPQFNQSEKPGQMESQNLAEPNDLALNGNGVIIPNPNPTAPRTVWHRTRSSLSGGNSSHGWADFKVDSLHNGFASGPKKPRTQVSYSLPQFDLGSKHRSFNQRTVPHKRIRRPNEKVSDTLQRNFDLLSCEANVLVTHGDRGWRECGAQVVLELAEQSEWKLAIRISGNTQYSYKAHQFLQPGSTNRYTHAMMWKGGKDWTLEFPDRGQWALFKEMHEECYNRNIRAASIKSIPIPGVRIVDENDDSGPEGVFVRSSLKYFRQVETDVEMALNPSRVLYDMDSDDEKWMSEQQGCCDVDESNRRQLSEEVFERTMDLLEKTAYVQQHDQFTSEEIEGLLNSVGPMELVKTIYEHWRQKRQKKGMPLIRHLQPPLWERYQQQVKEWELSANRANSALSNGCKKAPAPEKPPMFAFCMKPRGLEVPNKGSKQRSYKKISVSAHNHAVYGDHDSLHAFGRRSNGYGFGDERAQYQHHSYDYLDDYSPVARFSPRSAFNHGYSSMGSDGYYHPALRRSKSKKFGSLISPRDRRTTAGYSPTAATGWRNGGQRRNYQSEAFRGPVDSSEMDEFAIRDASSAAQHARNLAKLKRERARRMCNRADLAIHKAVAALMTAEAMKASLAGTNSGE